MRSGCRPIRKTAIDRDLGAAKSARWLQIDDKPRASGIASDYVSCCALILCSTPSMLLAEHRPIGSCHMGERSGPNAPLRKDDASIRRPDSGRRERRTANGERRPGRRSTEDQRFRGGRQTPDGSVATIWAGAQQRSGPCATTAEAGLTSGCKKAVLRQSAPMLHATLQVSLEPCSWLPTALQQEITSDDASARDSCPRSAQAPLRSTKPSP